MKQSKELNEIKKKIIPILKENKVSRAGIFGSYARGEQTKNSDVDILVEINLPQFSLFDFVGLKLQLEDLLNKKVDLVEYKLIKPRIKDSILNDEVKVI
jgi:uncharacterized protein